MGYRSDVKALIYPQGGEHNLLNYDKLKLIMNTTFKDVWDYWSDDYFKWDDKHRALVFDANSVKWYESYPEVAKFTQFLQQVHELEYEFEFIRLGEEDDDVEADSSGDSEGYLYVSRSIEVSF